MELITDLHLHSKYSRAVSPRMIISEMAEWGKRKGIDLLATADFTHPLWLKELKANLEEVEKGIYQSKNVVNSPKFILGTEISSIYSQGGKGRRIHNLVFAPNFETVDKINAEFLKRGFNLMSDGRPIIGLSSRDLAELVLNIDQGCLIIPAHVWTPWFALYGSKSGFDSVKECFEDMSEYIYAVETGLSSDPRMNWRVKDLDNRQIVSFSDAHSPEKMGREVTVLQSKKEKTKFTYPDFVKAMKKQGNWQIGYTAEFYPEEGKYHYSGHRQCNFRQDPEETKEDGVICPVCGRPLTLGVMHRVEQLAGREDKVVKGKGKTGLIWLKKSNRPPYVMLVPLMEIIAETLKTTVQSQKVKDLYHQLVNQLGSEFKVLLKSQAAEISKVVGEEIAEAVIKVRSGQLNIEPGYDGVFGKVKIWSEAKLEGDKPVKPKNKQMSLL